MQIAARVGLLVQLEQRAAVEHFVEQLAVFLLGSVTPVNSVGAGQLGYLCDPVAESLQARRHGCGY